MIRMPCQLLFVRIHFLACLIRVVVVGLLGGMLATGGVGEFLPQAEKFKCFGGLVVVKEELSCKAPPSICWSVYVPTLSYGREIWVAKKNDKVADISGVN